MTDEDAVRLVAAGDLDVEDDAILARTARLVRAADPVPAGLVDRIRLALALVTADDDQVGLELLDQPLLAVRDAAGTVEATTVTFAGEATTLTVRTRVEDGQVRVDGWVAPAGAGQVEVHQDRGVVRAVCDATGRFVATGLGHGATRFVVRHPTGPVGTRPVEL